MKRWTADQEKAINHRKSNMLVSAAAGSGKTAVLVQRIIDIVTKDGVDIDRLLIVTFTNAAAAEMRERILEALSEKVDSRSCDGEYNCDGEYIRRQMTLINRASISTMHSFCIDVVRRYFHIVDIDPSFRIADSTESAIIMQEALDEVMESEYEKSEKGFIDIVEGFGGNREDARVQELILSIYYFIQSQPYPMKWLAESVEMLNIDEESLEESKWAHEIRKSVELELEASMQMLESAREICSRSDEGAPREYMSAIESDIENLRLLQKAAGESVSKMSSCIADISHSRLSGIRGKRKEQIDEALRTTVTGLRDDYKSVVDGIKSDFEGKTPKEQACQLKRMYPAMEKLCAIIGDFDALYAKNKLERGLLDFNDLEHYVLRILEVEEARSEISKRFEHIFIDEYQDSNIVQETIIDRIKRANNVFMVGDVKQSIYRFRLADPTLFIQKYNSYDKGMSSDNVRVDLSANFRSRSEILDGVNFIFESIMSKELGEVEYGEHARLNGCAQFCEADEPPVRLQIIDKKARADAENSEAEEISSIELEARLAASDIKALIGRRTYDPKKNEYRQIQYKDIVVLLRTVKNWAPTFMQTMREEGIPVYSDDNSGYFDVIEVQIFLNLLRIIDNRLQDIPLISVMRSVIGGFSIEDLANIRLGMGNSGYVQAVLEYANGQDELSQRIRQFLAKIEEWSEEARILKLDEFIWKLLIQTGYYYYVGAMPSGEQRQANLRVLVDRAAQFESSSINGLFNFIRFVDRLLRSRADMGSAKVLGENENLVRIMSIHKSKGLEFPVVIIAGLGKRFNLRDSKADILLHKELGIAPKYVDHERRIYQRTIAQMAMKKRMDMESLSEEMRILYVAMTRAVDRLVMIGSVNDIQKSCLKWCSNISPYSLSKAGSHMDWIGSALSRHVDGGYIRDFAAADIEITEGGSGKSRFEIEVLDKGLAGKEESSKLKRSGECKMVLERSEHVDGIRPRDYDDLIRERFSWEYRHRHASKIPSKVSVTQIAGERVRTAAYNIPSLVKKPLFMEAQKGLGAAERGTLIHFAMKHMDIQSSNEESSIQRQLEMMVENELITREEMQEIDALKIKRFFDSQLGRRLQKSARVEREAPFVMRRKAADAVRELEGCDDEILIQGIIDCYFYEGDGVVLVDYKSDRVNEGLEQEKAKAYEPQLRLYKEAIEKIKGANVIQGYIYFFETGKAVSMI